MSIELEPPIAGPDGKPRQRIVRAARGKAKEEGNGLDAAAQGRRFELIPFDKIAFDTTPAYLVKGIVPRVGLCVIWGPPKCGKSFLVFDLLMHGALGWKYRGRRGQQGAVVYCAFEGQAGLRNRVEAFRQRKLAEGAGGVPFYLIDDAMNLVTDHPALIFSIRAALGDINPAAVALDTLNRSMPGSESSDEDMTAYVKAGDALRMAFDCAVVIVHHCGHEGTRPRGHSSLMGAVDSQIAVKRDAADNIIATVELMKDGPQGDEFVSRLEVVEIGIDDKITSCVMVPADGSPPSRGDTRLKLTKGAKIALRALHEAIGEFGEVPPASNHIPPGVKTVKVQMWRTYAYKLGISDSSEARAAQQAFGRAHEHLIAIKAVAEWDGIAWTTN
jgi:AAA domain